MALVVGFGMLRIGERDVGRVEYKITSAGQGASRFMRGQIWAEAEVIDAAFARREVTIVRDDTGFAMEVVVEGRGPGTGRIVVRGAPEQIH